MLSRPTVTAVTLSLRPSAPWALSGHIDPFEVHAGDRSPCAQVKPRSRERVQGVVISRLSSSFNGSGVNGNAESCHAVRRGAEHGLELWVTSGEEREPIVTPDVVHQHDPARQHD